jgi:hypothetical protein
MAARLSFCQASKRIRSDSKSKIPILKDGEVSQTSSPIHLWMPGGHGSQRETVWALLGGRNRPNRSNTIDGVIPGSILMPNLCML